MKNTKLSVKLPISESITDHRLYAARIHKMRLSGFGAQRNAELWPGFRAKIASSDLLRVPFRGQSGAKATRAACGPKRPQASGCGNLEVKRFDRFTAEAGLVINGRL